MSGSTYEETWDSENKIAGIENIDSRAYITEKSILPIMNQHPWLVYGEANFHKTMETFGILPHDELFDLELGETLLIPASLNHIQIKGNAKILEVYL